MNVETGKALSHRSSVMHLSVEASELLHKLRANTIEERSTMNLLNRLPEDNDKPFFCKIDGTRFRLSHRLKYGPLSYSRILYGNVADTPDGTVLRYYLAVRKELKSILALLCAAYGMFFLVFLYVHPPANGEEYLYLLPLLLPLLIAALMFAGITTRQMREQELIDFISSLDHKTEGETES